MVLDDLISNTMKNMKGLQNQTLKQQEELAHNRVLLILKCKINGNVIELRGNNVEKVIDGFEILKKECEKRLSKGDEN